MGAVSFLVGSPGRSLFLAINFVLSGVPGSLVPRQRTEHQGDSFPHKLGGEVRMPVGSDFLREFVHLLEPEFFMGHFPAAKTQGHLDLHFFAKEVDGVTQLDAKVMRIDLRAELNLLHLVRMLVLARLFFLLGLLVSIFSKINQPAYRRICARGDLDQIHAVGSSEVNGIGQCDDSELLAFCPDDPDFPGANLPIDPHCGTRGERRTGGKWAAQDAPNG